MEWFFKIVSLESKSKWASGQEISYIQKKMAFSAIFCSLYKFRKWEIKIKTLHILMREKKRIFISFDIQKPLILGSYSLRHSTDKADSIN